MLVNSSDNFCILLRKKPRNVLHFQYSSKVVLKTLSFQYEEVLLAYYLVLKISYIIKAPQKLLDIENKQCICVFLLYFSLLFFDIFK